MEVSSGGRFSHTIRSDQLARGLRHSKRDPRNSGFLIESLGAVGKDVVLQVIDEMTRMEIDVAEDFPFPQLFVFVNIIIVCGQTKIYEWQDGSLVEKLTVAAGYNWSAVDFFEYIYMSNGFVAVVRSAANGEYSETTDLPAVWAMCNFNGQVLVGTPNVEIYSQGTSIVADAIGIDLSLYGEWS